jgi:putative transposase
MPNHVHLLIRAGSVPISRVVQGLLVAHTLRYHRVHQSSGHVWAGRFKSPVVQDDDHVLTVLRYIEANPIRAGLVDRAGDYSWSSFGGHGLKRSDDLLDPVEGLERLDPDPAKRRRLWSRFVHRPPDEAELAALRRSVATGLPFGDASWVEALGRDLGLDLTIRPRGRPRKATGPG